MNKEILTQKISAANIPDDLKQELLQMVQVAPTVDQALSQQLRARIQEASLALVDEIESDRVDEATAEFDQATAEIDEELGKTASEVGAQADAADLEEARVNVSNA